MKKETAKQLSIIPEIKDAHEKDGQYYPHGYTEKSTEEETQEFFLPVSGFIWLFPEEVEVVNHPIFQRLGYVYQLGQTCLVYRGATHKRLEHVLGTVHMVHRMIMAVKHNYHKNIKANIPVAACINPNEERFIRLGALLHDIGHVAAGHTLEDELCIIGKHDHDERLDLLFYNEDERWLDRNGYTLSKLLDTAFKSYIPKNLNGQVTVTDICRMLIRKHPENSENDQYSDKRKILENSDDIRLSICRDMIGNTICADILDYLYRDWYHLGKPKTFDERILQYMDLIPRKVNYTVAQNPSPSHKDVIAISLGKNPKIRTDAVSSILDLLESRYHLAESVLFHKTKLSASAMLDRSLFELWEGKTEEIEKFILPLSDEQLIAACKDKALENKKRVPYEILTCLEKRYLYSTFLVYSYRDLPDLTRKNIQNLYVRNSSEPSLPARNRAIALRLLEKDFDLPEGSIVMHCPSHKMNAKIAEVRISVDDEVEKFCKYEEEHDNLLSGGHLDAQIKRFERLWKIHFFVRKDLKNIIKNNFISMRLAIDKIILGNLYPGETPSEYSRTIATQLVGNSDTKLYGKKVKKQGEINKLAAHRKSNENYERYPTDAVTIKGCIEDDENK